MASYPGVRAAPLAPFKLPSLRLPLLDSYILRELAGPFAVSLGAFMLFWFGNIFFLAADFIINAHASGFLVLRFLLLRIPQSLPYAFPFAALFSSLIAFGRLVADNEITAMRTAGVPFMRIARTPLICGIAAFFLTYFLNDTIVPRSVELSTRTFYQIIYHTNSLPVVPGFFRKDDTTGRVFYVGNVDEDHRTLHNVMIFESATVNPFVGVMNAEKGSVEGAVLVLKNVRVTRFKRNGEVEVSNVAGDTRVGLPIGENADQFLNAGSNDLSTMNSKQLKSQIKAMESTGQGGSTLDTLKISLGQKIAFPFATFIAVVLSLPLAVHFGRKGRTLGIALSFLLFFVYSLMMSAFAALGRNEAVNPYIAAWIPNVVLGITGLVLFWRVEH